MFRLISGLGLNSASKKAPLGFPGEVGEIDNKLNLSPFNHNDTEHRVLKVTLLFVLFLVPLLLHSKGECLFRVLG